MFYSAPQYMMTQAQRGPKSAEMVNFMPARHNTTYEFTRKIPDIPLSPLFRFVYRLPIHVQYDSQSLGTTSWTHFMYVIQVISLTPLVTYDQKMTKFWNVLNLMSYNCLQMFQQI